MQGHLGINLSLGGGQVKNPRHRAEIRSVPGAALCSICVCGTELTKPCTKEVVARLMGVTRKSVEMFTSRLMAAQELWQFREVYGNSPRLDAVRLTSGVTDLV
jgi:hypothetical protein